MKEVRKVWCEQAQKFFPETIEKNGITHQLDKRTWTYFPMLTTKYTKEDHELLEKPIGHYGREWQKFMKQNYPFEIGYLEMEERYELIARKVDKEAEEMAWNLEQEYARNNPRPTTFMEIVKWKKMKQLEVDHRVMTDLVLQYSA